MSVENRQHGLPRLEHLQATPAAVRFLSVEPLLEDLGPLNLAGIHWMIVGGESGHGARPLEPAWVIRLREQCDAAHIPFFFKQWGGVRKGKTGRELGGRTYDEIPPASKAPMAPRAVRLRLIEELHRRTEQGPFIPGS